MIQAYFNRIKTLPATTPVPTPTDAVEGLVSQAEDLWEGGAMAAPTLAIQISL